MQISVYAVFPCFLHIFYYGFKRFLIGQLMEGQLVFQNIRCIIYYNVFHNVCVFFCLLIFYFKKVIKCIVTK